MELVFREALKEMEKGERRVQTVIGSTMWNMSALDLRKEALSILGF